ncbi:hypothetical protein AtNW77_Chr3g0219531 [Arabidopsis thaliana]|uniref:Uncharacterized protein n=3 Tax=Arabidopsis TaxID=3701 RepID=A0A654FK36_ARATH|nr:uncharacterized protein AT3G62528 [Arabidopsis thaliana]AEE80360.1 hypothetical protein AT3G62528 [Arabidopsis thaliana]KAG7629437.1 hypothetical protein ISN45_At03g055680 [Arabidopsis thaliana x Arabidopsis arenosa]CAA0388092.1 unnamed protein product [Arabidopsis thaliana]VYS61204.1 unnamed protein product [Arabidopsis thaliana]|eukprot:NP_001118892.1 hypothetical protein AT3G62528 [Arabidopsis thaliana]
MKPLKAVSNSNGAPSQRAIEPWSSSHGSSTAISNGEVGEKGLINGGAKLVKNIWAFV